MITVEKILDENKKDAKIAGEQNEELLKTGELSAKKKSYLPWIFLAAAGFIGAILLWKYSKKDNGAIPN